jgi:hypothetical protein
MIEIYLLISLVFIVNIIFLIAIYRNIHLYIEKIQQGTPEPKRIVFIRQGIRRAKPGEWYITDNLDIIRSEHGTWTAVDVVDIEHKEKDS